MASNAILYRMPSGIPGAISRHSQSTIEPATMDPNNPFPAYGLFGKIVNGKLIPLAAGDAAGVIYGLLVRAYPTQGGNPSDPIGAATPRAYGIGDVLRRGYMTVRVNAGTAAMNGQVYVRVGGASAGKPLGGIEAVADATPANTIVVNAVFMSAADASGNVEIAYNI